MLGFGALLTAFFGVSWLVFFQSFGSAVLLTLFVGGPAAFLLLGGLVLWGRRYREIVAGILLIGTGLEIGLFGAMIGFLLSDYMEFYLPDDFDLLAGERMAMSSVLSTIAMTGAGSVIIALQIRRYLRSR